MHLVEASLNNFLILVKEVVDFGQCNLESSKYVTACREGKLTLKCEFIGRSTSIRCSMAEKYTHFECPNVDVNEEVKCCDYACDYDYGKWNHHIQSLYLCQYNWSGLILVIIAWPNLSFSKVHKLSQIASASCFFSFLRP